MKSQNNYKAREEISTASLGRRIVAIIYDLFPLFGIFMGVAMLIVMPTKIFLYGFDENWSSFNLPLQIILTATMIYALSSYFLYCWRKQGQTLGMKAWRIKLIQKNGQLADKDQCIKRLFFSLGSFLCFGIGYWSYFFSKDKNCLHDVLSETRVILLPKK